MKIDSDMEDKQKQLEAIIKDYFHKLKCSDTLTIPSTDINIQTVSVKLRGNPLREAEAKGLNINKDDLSFMGNLDQFNILDKIVIGEICVYRDLIYKLSDDEINFLLAHEVAHIYCNHPLSKETLKNSKKLFEDRLRDYDELVNSKVCEFLKEGKDAEAILKYWKIIKNVPQNLEKWKDKLGEELPSLAYRCSQQEIDADLFAICLTKDKKSAISCLEKLKAENLILKRRTEPLQQRITEIKKRDRFNSCDKFIV